jgi:hypothetical protein
MPRLATMPAAYLRQNGGGREGRLKAQHHVILYLLAALICAVLIVLLERGRP